MVSFLDLLDLSNNWFTAYREKRDGRNPMTGSLLGDTFETNYNILGTPYVFKRPKRNGRNPQTGAFMPMTRSGVVDLNNCLPFGDQNICVHIADKTGYSNLNGSVIPDLVGLIENVNTELIIDEVTGLVSHVKYSDSYNNESLVPIDETDTDYLGFIIGGGYLYLYTDGYTHNVFTKNGVSYNTGFAYRNLNGDLIASIRNNDTEELSTIVLIHNAFPIFQP